MNYDDDIDAEGEMTLRTRQVLLDKFRAIPCNLWRVEWHGDRQEVINVGAFLPSGRPVP